jgi:hypothetical protein
MEENIILSDGQPCTVRVLGLFELDEAAPDNAPGPFYEKMESVEGKIVSRLYVPPDKPPEEPTQPRSEAKEGTQLFEEWLEHDLYQEYVEHRHKEAEFINEYAQDAKDIILDRCLAKEDLNRIVTDEDWRKIHGAALSSQLTEEDIAAALRNNFQGDIFGQGNLGDNAG